ncbi:MAG: hypothetical protein AB3X44_16075 [Leptothrix sp. (in: b-proteobacteria)]
MLPDHDPDEKMRRIVREAITDSMLDAFSEGYAEHSEDHQWVRAQIQKERDKAEFYRNLKIKSFPAILATVAIATASWTWRFLTEHWRP